MFRLPSALYFSACLGSLFLPILCTCCSHFFWYCFISFTMFCAPVFSLIQWFFSCIREKRGTQNIVQEIKVDMVSGFTQMLICKTHKSWENQPQQQQRLCRQILLPRSRRLRPHDPWAMQLKLQQTERVQAKVQRLKTGPIQLREHTPTEKHAGLEASRWQPHH